MVHYGKKPEKNITKTFGKEEEERLEIIRVTLKNWDLVFLQDHTDFGKKISRSPMMSKCFVLCKISHHFDKQIKKFELTILLLKCKISTKTKTPRVEV